MNLELFSKGSKLKVSPSKALSSFKSFIEGYTQRLESSADAHNKNKTKLVCLLYKRVYGLMQQKKARAASMR